MKAFFESGGVTLYHGDARKVLPCLRFPVGTLTVTDPPYGTGGWRRSTSGAGSNPSGKLAREAWDDGAVDWLTLAPRPVLTFWPAAKTSELLNAANALGLTKHRTLYLRKRDPKPMPAGRTRWSVEPIWALSADGFVLEGGDDVWEDSTPRLGRDADATGHPYQKPIDCLLWLLQKAPGRLVVDPFAGSGTTLLAARILGRPAVGIEERGDYCEMAARRLRGATAPLALFAPPAEEPPPAALTLFDAEPAA